jgi:glyoxylase-like metal-dependent hydrolase (beta-lactamase superfamily II)
MDVPILLNRLMAPWKGLIRSFAGLVLGAVWLTAPLIAQPKPKYEIYGIRYATLKDFSVAGLVAGADKTRKMDIAMMIWLIKGEGRNILFDCGFYREQFMRQWHPVDYERPDVALQRTGLKPEDITDVIISHIHWDHADGFDLFPKAKIWIQKDELEYYAGEAWQGHKRTAADPEDLLGLVKLNTEGKVGLVNGDAQEILPGITCYIGGKHTYQSQYVGVNTAGAIVVLASDNVYLNENLEKHVPIAATLDPDSNLRAQDRMKQLAASPKLILTGHDPAVMKNFPEVAPRVVKIQ